MELFFKFIQLLKGLVSRDHGVEYVIPEKLNRITSFKVQINTRINTYDSAITTRYYQVVGLSQSREITNFYRMTNSGAVKRLCTDVSMIIEQHSGVKIAPRKLYNSVKKQYNGKIIVDGITIEFIQTW